MGKNQDNLFLTVNVTATEDMTMRNGLLFERHCGIAGEQPAWENWQRRALAIAARQRSRAVFWHLDNCSDGFVEDDAWTAFCENVTPRSWCASLAFAKRVASWAEATP